MPVYATLNKKWSVWLHVGTSLFLSLCLSPEHYFPPKHLCGFDLHLVERERDRANRHAHWRRPVQPARAECIQNVVAYKSDPMAYITVTHRASVDEHGTAAGKSNPFEKSKNAS